MRIVTLLENTAADTGLTPEHGLSLYIETGEHKILFDMGQTDAFARNAKKLGIDLSQVDVAVLSHGHYDHGGGLETFLQINEKAPVYVHEEAFGAYYNGTQKYIGMPPVLLNSSRLILGRGYRDLGNGICLCDSNDQSWTFDSYGLNRKEGDCFAEDDFRHEQYLQITEGKTRFLFSGCSHKGIVNIVKYFNPDCLVGGFHLSKEQDPKVLQEVAQTLRSVEMGCYTGHCTGSTQFAALHIYLGKRLTALTTGMDIVI